MNVLEKIILALQFEIDRPNSYGLFHIMCIIVSVLITIFLTKRKEKNHKKALKQILFIYGFGALVLEILKQIIWSFNYDNITNMVSWDYQWYAFPFQLCTTPIIISIICLLLKKGKIRDSLLSYMAFITILGSLATAIYPESCFVRTLLVDIHTMYLHFGSLIISIYLIASNEVDLEFNTFINGYIVFIIFVILAEILNVIIYNCGILNNETFNMFYISPYFISGLPIYDVIQSKVPFLVYLCFYLFSIFVGGLIIRYIALVIHNIDNK